jgi:sphinganine-1-phosphate aldolase
MAKAISSNTIVLVGSAPQFPHGIIDPIEDIAKLAVKHNIGLHVDCCLGGFVLPFMEKAGFKLDPFDFRVKGVTSISADTHKYGYTPKGTSVLMYSNKELRQRQYFVDPNWQGGVYATPGISGSRAGCLIATTWATLMYMGEDGYVDATRRIIKTTRTILKGMEGVAGVRVIGKPQAMVIGFDSADFDVFRLADALHKRGWNLNVLQFPSSFHLCVTMVHTKEGVAGRFVSDMKECVALLLNDPKAKATGQAAFYGQATSITDRSIINEIAREYIDLLYKATPPSHKK